MKKVLLVSILNLSLLSGCNSYHKPPDNKTETTTPEPSKKEKRRNPEVVEAAAIPLTEDLRVKRNFRIEKYGIDITNNSDCVFTEFEIVLEIERIFRVLDTVPHPLNTKIEFTSEPIHFRSGLVAGLTGPNGSIVKAMKDPNGKCMPVNQILQTNRNAFGHEIGHVIIEQDHLFKSENPTDTADRDHTRKDWWREID